MQVPEYFTKFIVYYIEDAVFNGEQTSRRKYLQRYCAIEGCEYDALQENLNFLIDVLNEYKEKKSEVSLKMVKYLIRSCFLPDDYVEYFQEKLSSWEKILTTYSSYMKNRGGDIFNEMPGGALLKEDFRCFNFEEYVGESKSKPDRQAYVNKYIKQYGIKKESVIEEHPFYKDYLSKFEYEWELATPDDADYICLKDWDLLSKLIFGSFSSSYSLILDEEWKKHPTSHPKVHICITISNEKENIMKMLDDLWSFQIPLLITSYIDEQIRIISSFTNEEKKDVAINKREKIEKFNMEKKKIMLEIKKYSCKK